MKHHAFSLIIKKVLAIFLKKKNIDLNVFDDVLQNTKHRANDASNNVNRPPLAKTDEILNQTFTFQIFLDNEICI